MLRMILDGVKQIEYFLIGDLRRLFWNRLSFVNILANSSSADVVTTRIGPPISGAYTNLSVVKGSMPMINAVLGASRAPLHEIDQMLGGKIFFSEDGPDVVKKHNAFKREVVLPSLHAVYEATIARTQTVCDKWLAHERHGQDIRLTLSNICLGVVGETMLGLKSIPDETHEVLTNAMRSAANHAFNIPYLPTEENKNYQKNKKAMHDLQVKLMEDNQDTILSDKNYIHTLLEEKVAAEGGSEVDHLLDQDILAKGPSTLLAGENVASLSILVITKLIEQPEIMGKLYDEISRVDLSSLKYNDIIRLPYLNCIYQEALRYFSPTDFISRELLNDITIEGQTIPKGPVFVPVGHLHHDASHWKNPDEFNPERFFEIERKVNKKGKSKESHDDSNEKPRFFIPPNQHFLAFSAGPRVCPGQAAAEIIFKVLMIKLLQDYQLKPMANQKVDIVNDTGSTKLRSPYIVALEPRSVGSEIRLGKS